jgi:hypothetical protein
MLYASEAWLKARSSEPIGFSLRHCYWKYGPLRLDTSGVKYITVQVQIIGK